MLWRNFRIEAYLQISILIANIQLSNSMIKYLLILTIVTVTLTNDTPMRSIIDYKGMFSQTSDVTALFISCSDNAKLKLTLQSFLATNTQPLKKIIIAHCYQMDLRSSMPTDYSRYPDKIQTKLYSGKKSAMQVLTEITSEIATQYLYLSDSLWRTIKGTGFIEQSRNVLKKCEKEGKPCYQVVSAFPFWRSSAMLKQMQWTETGEKYHEIYKLNDQFEYFSFSPSLINRKNLLTLLKTVEKQGLCKKEKVADFDLCLLRQISRKVEEKGYKLLYLNEGSGIPNVAPNIQ